jgi:ankyrin repeat protein
LFIPLLWSAVQAADPAETAKRIRENDLAWLKQQPARDLIAAKDARQNTPLIWAASLGSLEAVNLLLGAGANPNEANALGITPLIAAAIDADKVKALLAAGADVKAKSNTGQHALAAAAAGARASDSVKLLLAAGAPVNERSAQGSTPLLAALGNSCHVETARLLLAAGADPKAVDGAGFGAAHGAIGCGPEFLREVLKRGANVNQQNLSGGKVRHGDIQLIGLSPLMLAAPHQNTEIVRILLDAGADPHAKDVRGLTPLHFAVASEDQNAATVALLLARGAKPGVKDNNGEDVLAWARKFNNTKVLKLLGAKPHQASVPARASSAGPGTLVALQRLEQGNEDFFKQSGCNGCHHSNLLSFAASRAQRAGLTAKPELIEARRQRLKGQFSFFLPAQQQMLPLPGDIDSDLYGLLEAQSLGLERSAEFETAARYLWAKQLPNGSWSQRGISRSPIEESDHHRTALAIWLLPQYSDAASKAQAPSRIREAVAYLEARPASNTDERALKLLGLKWGAADAAFIAKAAKDLAVLQNQDGSWSGNRQLSGDAYSTGLALFALREGAGWPAGAKPLAAGVRWLRDTQHQDGTWFVRSRSPKFQPYFESGFPYGHDQWISSAATAWAVAGLSEAGAIR